MYILVNPVVPEDTPLPDLFDGRDYEKPWVFSVREVAVDWCAFCSQVYPEITHFDMTVSNSPA